MFDMSAESFVAATYMCACVCICFYALFLMLIKKGKVICCNHIHSVISRHDDYRHFSNPYSHLFNKKYPLSRCLIEAGLIPKRRDALYCLEGLLRKAIAEDAISLNIGQVNRLESKRLCDMNRDEVLLVWRALFLKKLLVKDVFSYRYLLQLAVSRKAVLLLPNGGSGESLHKNHCKMIYFRR